MVPAVPVFAADFSNYHDYEALTKALKQLTEAHSNLARLVEIAKSPEGRSIWVVELANLDKIPVADRPGILVGANFEANQLFGTELSLFTIQSLLDSYDSDPSVEELLKSHVIYFIPRANPDGAEKMFQDAVAGETTNNRPFDNDNDGRLDEDGYEDLNGDGIISVMRKKDPKGIYMVHPEEERLLKKADPSKGEAGAYQVYWEGVDNDKDGFINEDPVGGVDLNRNFQHRYPYYSIDAGPHMVSEAEARGIMDFVLANRNIAMMLVFGSSDNLINPPNSRGELQSSESIDLFEFANQSFAEARKVGTFQVEPDRSRFRFMMGGSSSDQDSSSRRRRPARMPEEKVNPADIPYFSKISSEYKKITGIDKLPAVRMPAGAFFEFGYFQYGVPSFSTPGWGLTSPTRVEEEKKEIVEGETAQAQRAAQRPPQRSGGARAGNRGGPPSSGESDSGSDARFDMSLLKWMDSEGIPGFAEWSVFDHPDLGEVEIGGFKPMETSNPPIEKISDLGPKHVDFVKYMSTLFPKVVIAETKVTNLGAGLFKVEAGIENTGYLPTVLAHGVVSMSVKPTMVQLGIPPENLVSGDAKTSFFQSLNGSGGRRDYTWIIKGNPGDDVILKVVAQKAGSEAITLSLE
jgi:hypothetical protein